MALKDVLAWLQDAEPATPATPPQRMGLQPKPSIHAGCTPATPATPHPDVSEAANDAAPTQAPGADRWCWPHSDAMNSAELESFAARLARFVSTGMRAGAAESLADRLVKRDRDADDRVSCAECRHGRSTRCPDGAPLPRDVLHRCDGFSEGTTG